jgi:hypothetical protein
MLYQCITTNNELKAGKAIAQISCTENWYLENFELNWEWLDNKRRKKVFREYLEI